METIFPFKLEYIPLVLPWFILLSVIAHGLLAILAFANMKEKRGKWPFMICAGIFTLWSLSNLFIYTSPFPIFVRFAYAGGALLSLPLLVWILYFSTDRTTRVPWWQPTVLYGLSLGIVSLVFIDGVFISDIVPSQVIGFENSFGFLFPLYSAFFFLSYLAVIAKLIHIYVTTTLIRRKRQLKIILSGFVVFGAIFVFVNIALPARGVSYFIDFDVPGSLFLLGAIVYAIIRYRFLGIRFVSHKVFVYTIIGIMLAVTVYLLAASIEALFGTMFTPQSLFIIVPVSILLSFVFKRLLVYVEAFSENIFYTEMSPTRADSLLLSELNSITNSNQLMSTLVKHSSRILETSRVAAALFPPTHEDTDTYTQQNIIMFNEGVFPNLILTKEGALYKDLTVREKTIITEELSVQEEKTAAETSLLKMLTKEKIAVVIPLCNKNTIIGALFIGDKTDSRVFTLEDIQFLENVSEEIGPLLQTIYSYQHLKERVVVQARTLKENREMKSSFLGLIQHQLRAPTLVINEIISLFDELNEKPSSKDIQTLKERGNILKAMIENTLLSVEIDSGTFTVPESFKQQTDVQQMIEKLVVDFQKRAAQKNLTFSFEKPDPPVPPVFVAKQYFRQAIRNILTNALYYTSEGFIRVRLYRDQHRLFIEVSDSGIGIPRGDTHKIFDKFFRSNNVYSLRPNSAGLGLFTARGIIQAHGGSISVESTKDGSIFTVSLPLYRGS